MQSFYNTPFLLIVSLSVFSFPCHLAFIINKHFHFVPYIRSKTGDSKVYLYEAIAGENCSSHRPGFFRDSFLGIYLMFIILCHPLMVDKSPAFR